MEYNEQDLWSVDSLDSSVEEKKKKNMFKPLTNQKQKRDNYNSYNRIVLLRNGHFPFG